MNNIISGLVLIAIGIFNGGSVFTGNPSGIDYLFDIGGMAMIAYGAFQLKNGR